MNEHVRNIMTMQELEIIIGKDGRVQIAVRGVKGEGCLALTRKMEEAIGTVEEQKYSPEYYEQPVETSLYQNHRVP